MALNIARLILQASPLLAGVVVALLGVAVLVGWSTHATALVAIRPWLPPMRPIAALGFVFSGLGLISLRQGWRRAGQLAALAVIAVSLTALPSYLSPTPARDAPRLEGPAGPGGEAEWTPPLRHGRAAAAQDAAPAQFGPNAAIAFALAALAMLAVQRSVYVGATLGVGVLALGAVAMLGYAVDVMPAIGWGRHIRMSAHTALGFTVLGAGLVLYALERERHLREERSWWRPVLVGMTAAAAGLLFWTALRSQERDTIDGMVEAAARGVVNDMETTTESIVLALTRLAERGYQVGWKSPVEWQRDARLTVGAFLGFESIEWIDADFVPRVVAARDGAEMLAVTDGNESRLRKALAEARRTSRPVMAGPFEFVGEEKAFCVIVPFRSEGHPEAYLAGVFSARRALTGLSQHLNAGYSIVVTCEGNEVFRDGEMPTPRWTRRMTVRLPGPIPWEIALSPRKEVLSALATPLPTVALTSSLLIAILLTLTLRFGDMAALRARSLGEAVTARTRELEQSMMDLRTEVTERRRTEAVLRRTQTLGRLVSAELDLEKAVQAVTDAATELTGARCGCLTYAVQEDEGPPETRSAIAGDIMATLGSPEAVRQLRPPRFDRAHPIRIDDLRTDPRASALTPFDSNGGHPGLASYLAVPVVSRSGRVRGALLLGHPAPGVFGAREEEIAASLAAQAAIAMDNAMLYEAERRATSRAQSTNEAKDNFIHMLGHELRNPLGSIRTALQVLSAASRQRGKSGRAHPEATEEDELRMRRIIDRQVDQLARLADDLLQVSQLSSAKVSLRPEAIDLADLVAESVESVRARFEGAGLRLEAEIPEEPVTVWADPHRIRQIVANLLANARKFCDAGQRVTVHLDVPAGENQAVITVKDTGCGIDQADLARVFEPFVQTELARDRMTGGLGLGLPIVKGLVEAQGGSVSAFSAGRDLGAEFRVCLPLHHAPAVPRPAALPPAAATASRRILVIDDHRDSADALKRLLGLSGNEVEVAYDGPRGIELAHRFRPDVLICDIGLPGMDGFEVARRLNGHPETESIRLIALTGYGDEDTIRAAREAGFRHHLTKPVQTEVLERLLAESA